MININWMPTQYRDGRKKIRDCNRPPVLVLERKKKKKKKNTYTYTQT
jgi:hypothetical protein